MKKAASADAYYAQAQPWHDEQKRLRELVLAAGLTEEVKWGGPCYTCNGQNVVGVGGFKSYFGLWFHQGALLADSENVLINAQEGKTRALRQWRMTSPDQIKPRVIAKYLKEAKALAEAGKRIEPRRARPITVPPELKNAMAADTTAGAAFEKLRPGQRREYAEYVTEARRADTKQKRIAKILPMIAAGAGLNDRYR